MLKFYLACLLSIFALPAMAQDFPEAVYAPLWKYNGTWTVNISGQNTVTLINRCAQAGLYFACGQTADGKNIFLIVFIPLDIDGHYRTSPISANGTPKGAGDLEIKGNHWSYSSTGEKDGEKIYYRTTNDFTDNNHVHFESATSTDHQIWKVESMGDEVKIVKSAR